VILEEIRRGNDDPGSQIGRAIFKNLYTGTEAGRPVIGFAEEVAKFPRETLTGFWKRWYTPENMSLVVVGNIPVEKANSLANKYFGNRAKGVSEKLRWGSGRHRDIRRVQKEGPIEVHVIKGDYQQTRMDIVIPAPSVDAPDCVEFDTAAYILGGSEVSRLQRRLKEQTAVVNSIGTSAYTPVFEGIFEVSIATDVSKLADACFEAGKELKKFMGSEPATEQEVERAKAASRLSKIHREETVSGVASAIVSSLATVTKERFEEFYEHLLESMTPFDIDVALKRHWDLSKAMILVLCDKDEAPSPESLRTAFLKGVEAGAVDSRKASQFIKKTTTEVKAHEFKIGDAVKVIYRHVPDTQMFSFAAATEGGLRGETIDNNGTFHAMATLMGLATKTKNYEQFSGRLEDLGTILGGFSGKDSLGFEMHCVESQLAEMTEHLADAMLNPIFPDEQWESYRRETLESLKTQRDSPSWICMRRLHQAVFGNHPYVLPVSGYEETINGFSAKKLEQEFVSWRDGGPWVFAASGGVNPDTVQKLLQNWFRDFNPTAKKRNMQLSGVGELTKLNIPQRPKRKQEQAHLALATQGPKWGNPSRAAVDVITNVLGGHSGRLFSTLREQQSLAYSVSPLHSQGVAGGIVGAYIATAVEKYEQAVTGLKTELSKMAAHGPTEDEIKRAKSYILGSHEIGLQRASSQAMTMALMEIYGLGWADFEKYPALVRNVTTQEIKKAAAEFFDPKPMNLIAVGV
jgi:zinc protease